MKGLSSATCRDCREAFHELIHCHEYSNLVFHFLFVFSPWSILSFSVSRSFCAKIPGHFFPPFVVFSNLSSHVYFLLIFPDLIKILSNHPRKDFCSSLYASSICYFGRLSSQCFAILHVDFYLWTHRSCPSVRPSVHPSVGL